MWFSRFINTNISVSTSELLSEDIWKQREVIIDELEPKRFMNMLRDIDGSAAIVDVIMNKDLSRRVRCDAMVTFLENKGATKQFQEELEKQKMYDLINLLKSKNDTLSEYNIVLLETWFIPHFLTFILWLMVYYYNYAHLSTYRFKVY